MLLGKMEDEPGKKATNPIYRVPSDQIRSDHIERTVLNIVTFAYQGLKETTLILFTYTK